MEFIEGYQGIIFDLDDTLYSEKDYVRSGYRKIAEKFIDSEDVYNRLWSLFTEGRPAIDELLAERQEASAERKKELLDIYRYHIPSIYLYSGVKQMLSDLKAEGKKLGLITDGRVEGQKAKIATLQLENYFDDIIITDSLGGIQYRKPNTKAYELMHEKWDIPYKEMVYIGDNTKKDFIAPNQLGMGTIWFQNADGLYQ